LGTQANRALQLRWATEDRQVNELARTACGREVAARRDRLAHPADHLRHASELYGELTRIAPSAVVAANRAVAVGTADGPATGLLDELLLLRDRERWPPRGAYRARASGSGSAGRLTPLMPLALRSNWTRRERKSIHAIFTSATRLEHNSVAHPDDAEDTVPADRTKVSHVIALLRVSEATRKGRRPGTHSLARAVRGS